MAENNKTQHPTPDLSNPELRHEHKDVNPWAIGKVAIGLVLVTIASVFAMMGVFHVLELRENAAQPVRPANARNQASSLPPAPNVIYNEHEATNRQEIQATEDQNLNSYGWVDQAHGVVRLPIDRAMDLLVQRGLPTRPQKDLITPPTSAKESSGK